MERYSFLRTLWMIPVIIISALLTYGSAQAQKFPGLTGDRNIEIDTGAREVRIRAQLQPEAFAGGWIKNTPHYHAIVSKKGKAAGEALLTADIDDVTFHDALVKIGAIPGNNLSMEAWNKRRDPSSKAPEMRVEGTPVEVLVWWEGLSSPVPFKDLLVDRGGRGLDMRFGGNKSLIHLWHSGCIVCLYSCPGGKVSNRAYTIRDYVKNPDNFSVNWSRVPKGKRSAVVITRFRSE
jgi:hypothetical protein